MLKVTEALVAGRERGGGVGTSRPASIVGTVEKKVKKKFQRKLNSAGQMGAACPRGRALGYGRSRSRRCRVERGLGQCVKAPAKGADGADDEHRRRDLSLPRLRQHAPVVLCVFYCHAHTLRDHTQDLSHAAARAD